MKYFGMGFKKKLSRRNFISLSSVGMALGISDIANKNSISNIPFMDNLINDTPGREPDPVRNRVIHLHPQDNVAVALENLSAGTKVSVDNLFFELAGNVAVKHKFALTDLAVGDPIFLYGIKVGSVVKPVVRGTAITTENIVNATGEIHRGVRGNIKWTPPEIDGYKNRTFMGYHRENGQVGTANYWLVIPMVFCENRNVGVVRDAVLPELGYQQVSPFRKFTRELISQYTKEASFNELSKTEMPKANSKANGIRPYKNVTGIRFLIHSGGCGEARKDSEELCGLLAGYITHSNVAGATILSLGCQNAQLSILQTEIKKRDAKFSKPYFEFEQQKIGTEEEMIKKAIESIFEGLAQADQIERKPAPLSKLCIGMECGGSDGFSGISANPAIGYVSDMIVALGGSVILSEFPELSGVEQNLYDRCTNQADADKFLDLMRSYNDRAISVGSGFDKNPSPGNIKDGLITDAMKSAGAAKKGGTSPVKGVFDYPEKIEVAGLSLLCTPGNDVESVTAEVGSGANMVLFTTGLGTPTGNPIAPVIKISTNTSLALKMADIIDINAGTIIEGTETIRQTAERILDNVIEVASGTKQPASVTNDQVDFIHWKRGISL